MTTNTKINLEEYEEYNEKELEYIDKYKELSNNTMEVYLFLPRMKNCMILLLNTISMMKGLEKLFCIILNYLIKTQMNTIGV